MKRVFDSIAICLSILTLGSIGASASSCRPETDDELVYTIVKSDPQDKTKDPVRTFRYAELKAQGHPRILISKSGFEDLKKKVADTKSSHETICKLHNLAIATADQICANQKEVIEYKLDAAGKRLLTQSRKTLNHLFNCSYAYKMTKEYKYLRKVKEDLKIVCTFEDWHPSHYLDVGEIALAVAIAYDWLYDDLTFDERVMARKALKAYAMDTAPGKGFYTAQGNWNQVCNAGVIAAAMATYEYNKEASADLIEKGLSSNKEMMKYIYSPDGNYSEGYNYWGYGTGFQTIINMLFQNAFGTTSGINDVPGFMRTDEYMLFMGAPCGCFPYADGGGTVERAHLGMWYFAGLKDDPSLLYNEIRLLDNGEYPSSGEIRLLPAAIIAIKDSKNMDSAADFRPKQKIWYGKGITPVIMVHTSWTNGEDDHYLGIKGGSANDGHAHMDAGSFVYDALGQRWSDDYYRPEYAGIENALKAVGGNFWDKGQKSLRWDIFKMNNLSHSTISVMNSDGSVERLHPSDHYYKGSATIKQVIDNGTELGGTLDLTPVFKGQLAAAERTVKLVGEKDLVIVDVLTATASMDAEVQWRMLSRASAEVGAEAITLSRNGKTMYLTASCEDGTPVLSKWAPGRPENWDPEHTWDTGFYGTIVGYTLSIPAGKTYTVTTVLSPEN